MKMQFKEQQCTVMGLAFGWMAYAVGAAYFSYRRQWVVALLWMAGVAGLRWALYHFFPRISQFLGYGRIADKFSSIPGLHDSRGTAPVDVTFYTFFSCPFCPIVLARLEALQQRMGFTLSVVDVTLRPQTLMTKGIRSVPVVEVGDRRLVGNSTTEQLTELIGYGADFPTRERAQISPPIWVR